MDNEECDKILVGFSAFFVLSFCLAQVEKDFTVRCVERKGKNVRGVGLVAVGGIQSLCTLVAGQYDGEFVPLSEDGFLE